MDIRAINRGCFPYLENQSGSDDIIRYIKGFKENTVNKT